MEKKVEHQKIVRRHYDEDFIASTLRLIESGRSVSDVARSLGINENIVYRWRSKRAGNSETGATRDEEKEAMRRYISQLETERDILKKALAIFSRTP